MEKKSINQVLKEREQAKRAQEKGADGNGQLRLDDTRRVKVLSPSRLVFKRFMRNYLALIGCTILIIMFAFSFLGPLVYPYSQTQIFYKYGKLSVDYASAEERTTYANYIPADAPSVHYSVRNNINGYIAQMEESGRESMNVTDTSGTTYRMNRILENVYTLSRSEIVDVANFKENVDVCTIDTLSKSFSYAGKAMLAGFEETALAAISTSATEFEFEGKVYTLIRVVKTTYRITAASDGRLNYLTESLGEGFEEAVFAALDAGRFQFGGIEYTITAGADGTHTVRYDTGVQVCLLSTTYVFDAYDSASELDNQLKVEALLALADTGSFEYAGKNYTIAESEAGIVIHEEGREFAQLSTFVVRAYSGGDTLPYGFKQAARETIEGMEESGRKVSTFHYEIPKLTEEGAYDYEEDGSLIYEDTEITVNRKNNIYVLNCEQVTYLIDIFARPNAAHMVGTDGDGMDVLARAMYGGRVSLLVGFVVVILEVVLGVIMGGISGYFGGWVDNLIMRIVDIFYCIPTLPVMIILGSVLDALKMDAYLRLVWMMAALGLLGWASVARLVRGQILSLREQEFMVAAESTGIRAGRRIFRHLVPNVMPQLIVYATMNLGAVIIYESTLSFLGLGVRHPLATWGTMINSVASSTEAMIRYTYIWVPVGILLCLTVIAFNFVGDGLRDAFDPKMKR